jgi:hypothetical protein
MKTLTALQQWSPSAHVSDVVVHLTTADLNSDPGVQAALGMVKNHLNTAGIQMIVALCPLPSEVSPSEALWLRVVEGQTLAIDDQAYDQEASALKASGQRVISLLEPFSVAAQQGVSPLFEDESTMLATAGRKAVANSLSEYFKASHT